MTEVYITVYQQLFCDVRTEHKLYSHLLILHYALAGSITFIKSKDLQSTDIDSEDSMLLYTVTQDTTAGHLQFVKGGHSALISSKGPIKTFLQSDINSGYIQFVHQAGEMTGVVLFKFDVEDSDNNKLIDQDFFITIIGKRIV